MSKRRLARLYTYETRKSHKFSRRLHRAEDKMSHDLDMIFRIVLNAKYYIACLRDNADRKGEVRTRKGALAIYRYLSKTYGKHYGV